MAEDFDDGIKTAESALQIFKELELRKLEAFELFIIAHYYLTRKMGREAIPYAEAATCFFGSSKRLFGRIFMDFQ